MFDWVQRWNGSAKLGTRALKFKLPVCFMVSLGFLAACSHSIQLESQSIQGITLDAIGEVVGQDASALMFQDASGTKFALLKVKTNPNLIPFIESTGSSVSAHLWFCNKPNQEVLLGAGVYKNGQDINLPQITQEQSLGNDQVHVVFDIVVFEAWERDWELSDAFANPKEQTHYLKYDNKSDPSDICIALVGGTPSFVRVKSNTIVVPSASVEAVFD